METMNHECYVSIEVAKLLKEAGFDWEIKTFYFMDQLGETMLGDAKNHNFSNQFISAPTLEVAQRWLMEEKNLILLIDITPSYCNGKPMGYKFVIHVSCGNHILGEWKDTYEEAQEAGIKKALEIIIKG